MKQVTIVVSHEGSGSSALCSLLDKNSRIQWCKPNIIYDHPFSLEKITSISHKLKNAAAIWLDEILYNHYFSSKILYEWCRFIYVIREAKPTLSLITESRADLLGKARYYTYRLRRICEMARRTPGAVLV